MIIIIYMILQIWYNFFFCINLQLKSRKSRPTASPIFYRRVGVYRAISQGYNYRNIIIIRPRGTLAYCEIIYLFVQIVLATPIVVYHAYIPRKWLMKTCHLWLCVCVCGGDGWWGGGEWEEKEPKKTELTSRF